MSNMSQNAPLSSRWIADFEKQVSRRKHMLLYGNVYDQFLHNSRYFSVQGILDSSLCDKGFELIVRYDPIDGFSFAANEPSVQHPPAVSGGPLPVDKRAMFRELVHRGVSTRNPDLSDNSDDASAPLSGSPDDPLQEPPRRRPGAIVERQAPRRISPEEAFAEIRIALAQNLAPVAAVVNLADMLTSTAEQFSLEERNALMLLKKCTLEATLIREGRLAGLRNTLVVLAGDLRRVPEWFYRDNPFVALVQAERPNKEERKQYALRFIPSDGKRPGFLGGDKVSSSPTVEGQPSDLELLSEEMADLTEGFQAIDMDALRVTSHAARIPVRLKQTRRLTDFFKFGVRDDPWEKLSPERVHQARAELSRSVIGQQRAVDAVVTMLTSARVGLTLSSSGQGGTPKGVFFFVGPTGVGKTELAKSLTKLVFGDERSFARFDMSEYKEEHAAEKLAGAPPGFVGYEAGGQLTNRVMQQPHSILLFDEIEKAHPKVLDKFLQILEDGRLTDGKGQTAYFNQTAIIFTSNLGASDLTDPHSGTLIREGIMRRVQEAGTDVMPPRQVDAHFQDEVKWYFNSYIGRAELLNRLGDNIVVFDLLRPDFVRQIGEKFLTQFADVAREKYKVSLRFLPTWLDYLENQMRVGDNMLMGGRRIKTLTTSHLVNQLNEWIFSNVGEFATLEHSTLEIGLAPDGALQVHKL